MRELLATVITVVTLGLFWLVVRKRREGRALPPPPLRADDSLLAPESTPLSFDGVRSAVRSGTPREERVRAIEDREQTGLCLYCDRPATRQVPQVMLVLSWFDRLYRKMNRVPANEWEIDVHPDVRVPHLLCDQHQPIARSHIEGYIADESASYARFVEKQRRDMYEFTAHALDERMLADATAIKSAGTRSGRRSKQAQAEPSNVRSIAGTKKEAVAS